MSPSDSRKITSQPGNVFSLSQLAERHKTKTPAASSSYLHSHSSLLSAQASHSASPPTVPSASSPRTVSLAHLAAQHKVGSNSPSREGSSLLALAAQHAARPPHAPALSLCNSRLRTRASLLRAAYREPRRCRNYLSDNRKRASLNHRQDSISSVEVSRIETNRRRARG